MNTEEGKKILKWAWIALVVLVVFLGVHTLAALRSLGDGEPATDVITVSGEGEIVSVPDVATFSFTVSADAATVNEAQTTVTERVNTVVAALEAMGIEEKDIKTTDYSVWPKYRYVPASTAIFPPTPGREVLDGYTANHSITVKVRDTQRAGEALGVAGDSGATNISGISFTVDDPTEVLEEARALAIEEAQAKAKVLAKDLGVRLGRVVGFSDNSNQMPPMPYGYGGDTMMRLEVGGGIEPSIPQGENKVVVNVSVTYEIR